MTRKKVDGEFRSVGAGSASLDTVEQTQAPEPEAPTGYQFYGPSGSAYRHGTLMSGGAWIGAIIPLVYTSSNVTFSNTAVQQLDTGELLYGAVMAPPGTVPILRLCASLQNGTVGESATVEVTNTYREQEVGMAPFLEATTEPSNTSIERFMVETYLSNEAYGQANQDGAEANNNNRPDWRINRYVSGASTGTLYKDATLQILYEVL